MLNSLNRILGRTALFLVLCAGCGVPPEDLAAANADSGLDAQSPMDADPAGTKVFSVTQGIALPTDSPESLIGSSATMRWPTLYSGDCLVDAGMTVSFSNLGAAVIEGQSRSTDTNDTWEMRFEFLRADGSIAVATGTYRHRMYARNTWYPFSFGFSFPREFYGSIRSGRAYYRC